MTPHSSGEESDGDSHSSVVGSLLEPLGHDSDSDQDSSAPVPDPNAFVDELADGTELAALADEFREAKGEPHDMNQDLEPELRVANSPRRTRKKKSPKKHRSAAYL